MPVWLSDLSLLCDGHTEPEEVEPAEEAPAAASTPKPAFMECLEK